MIRKMGETVYKYTLRNGEIFVHEGMVIEQGSHKNVYFKTKGLTERYPKKTEFGIVHSSGPSLWLSDRDDELAKCIFVEYEERCLTDLQKQIERKLQLIKALKGDS